MSEFDYIRLEPEQQEFFVHLAEAYRSLPRKERRAFLLIRSMSGTTLLHPELPQDFAVLESDMDTLSEVGLFRVNFGSGGTPRYDLTPFGIDYYKHLKEVEGGGVEGVEQSVRVFMDSGHLRAIAPKAHRSWSLAADQLWAGDSGARLSEIGHHCREALQYFVDELAAHARIENLDPDPAKTVARMRTVLDAEVSSKASRAFGDAALNYWGCVIDLVQRQEHGALKEGEELE